MKFEIYDIKPSDVDGFESLMPDNLLTGNYRYIGAIDEDEYAIGILVWHVNTGFLQLDHIAVSPEYIGEKIGKELLDYLFTKLSNVSEFAPVIAVYTDTPEYEAFDEFINSNEDFVVVESGRFHIVDRKAREESAYYQKLKEKSFLTESFKTVNPTTKKKFYFHLEKAGVHLFTANDEKNLIPELSKCLIKDGEITAVVLVSHNNLDELEVSFVYCEKKHSVDLGMCLTEAIKAADELYPEKRIVFNAENEQSIRLSKKLFGNKIEDVAVFTAVSFGKVEALK